MLAGSLANPSCDGVGHTCVRLKSGLEIQTGLVLAVAAGSEILLLWIFGVEFYFGGWLYPKLRYFA